MSLDDGRPTPDAATAADLAHLSARLDELLARLAAGLTVNVRWLPIDAAARYAGISEVSIRRLLATGKVTPHRPVPGRIVIDKKELDTLILASTARPRSGRGRRRIAV